MHRRDEAPLWHPTAQRVLPGLQRVPGATSLVFPQHVSCTTLPEVGEPWPQVTLSLPTGAFSGWVDSCPFHPLESHPLGFLVLPCAAMSPGASSCLLGVCPQLARAFLEGRSAFCSTSEPQRPAPCHTGEVQ